jgi:hypothetical protein
MLKCKECKKKYKWHNKWVDKHAKKFNHYKFVRIDDEFKYQDEQEGS